MNAKRLILITVLVLTLGAAGFASAATAPGSSTVAASVPTSITLTVTQGAVLDFGSVAPGACSQLGDLALNNRAVILTITANAPWNVSYASNSPTGRLSGPGNVSSVNAVQFQAGNGGGFALFADMTNVPVNWYAALQPAAVSAQVYGAVRWCAGAGELAGTYGMLIQYLATAP